MTSQTTNTRLRPVIRVFVSSTFSDMKHERNALETDAFPKLEQFCQRQGFQFQAIDLRWGVSTEAGLDHRTMRICFDELRRAQELSPKPNFLILLGNRYGWRPLPEEISVKEFHALEQASAQAPGSAAKSAVAVLREWYCEDTNAVPPVYLLQSRRQDLGDGQDYTHDAAWNQVQTVLWKIINRAMPPEQLQRRFDGAAPDGSPPAIVRFQASATEQEIWHGALRVPDAREHVLAFFREIENLAVFADPMPIKDFVDVHPSGRVAVALQTEQDRLKAELRQRLDSANVFRNETPVRLVEVQDNQNVRSLDVTTDHLAQLCADVVSRLSEIIQGQIDEYWRKTAQASTDRAARELEIEQREYERFAQERGGEESFVGRQVELQDILDYMGSDSRWPLVIHGASGCGKTALLARASQEVAKTRKRSERFIGVAPRSSDLRSLLSSLCQELRQRNPRPDPLPAEIKELRDEFLLHLQAATPDQPLILFLDALDQLADADNGRLLNWLPPGELPAHVKLVVSCLSDRATSDPAGQPYAELKRRPIPAENFINMDVLSEAEARLLLFDRWLSKAGRKVSDEQRAPIEQRLASPACRQPIFLKLLFEEVQLWLSYDPAPVPGESVPALLGQLFDRLSQPTNHGPLLVNRVLGYLSASRHGLAEYEILEILFADREYRVKLNEATEQTRHELPPHAKRIPIALWSRLRFDLAPYLTERAAPGANVLTFYHRQVAEWVRDQFELAIERPCEAREPTFQTRQAHPRLAKYFTACARGTEPQKEWETDSERGFSECVFHLAKAEQHEPAAGLLTNFPFLLHKLRVGLLEGVFEDYNLVQAGRDGPARRSSSELDIWSDFFREKAHILRRGNVEWPAHKILLQLAAEHADDSPLTIGAEQWLAEGHCSWIWIRRNGRVPQVRISHCRAVFEGHSRSVQGAVTLPRGRILSWAGERFYESLDRGIVDNSLRIWDDRVEKCLAMLEGHSDSITQCMVLSDGRILSCSKDATLRLWDNQLGQCLMVLRGHSRRVNGSLELPDGGIVSWSADHTIRLWDGKSDTCLAVLQGHSSTVFGVLALADGRLLSWSGDRTLRLWDRLSGKCVRVLKGDHGVDSGVMSLADRQLLSWSEDKTLRLWDSRSGACRAVFFWNDAISGIRQLADGRLLVLNSPDRYWDATKGMELGIWDGLRSVGLFGGMIRCLCTRMWKCFLRSCFRHLFIPDRKVFTRWTKEDRDHLIRLLGHTDHVKGMLELVDGRILSWSCDRTLRVWDSQSGECLAVFEGHTAEVTGALELADDRLLSWSNDRTLRVWDSQNGECLAVFEGHSDRITGALELADGRLLSRSDDKTLRLWDAQRGARQAVIPGVRLPRLLELADGRWLAWGMIERGPMRLYAPSTGACLAALEGHTALVTRVLELGDGRLLSCSRDSTLRLWDGHTGALLEVLEGHKEAVKGLCLLSNGCILSWSEDVTLRLWDSQNGECLAVFEGHTAEVTGAHELANDRLLSWSDDRTLRVWDSQNGECLTVFEGHTAGVTGALELANGRLLSWSYDRTLRVWDSQNGECVAVFEGHGDWISGAVELVDGRLLSRSADKTLRLWDGQNGDCLAVCKGHSKPVKQCAILADGRILSWSEDETLRLWDRDGLPVRVYSFDEGLRLFPEFRMAYDGERIVSCWTWSGEGNTKFGRLRVFGQSPELIFQWHGDSDCFACHLSPNGQATLGQLNGQLCFLQLHYGQRRISLTEAEELLRSQGKLTAVDGHPPAHEASA